IFINSQVAWPGWLASLPVLGTALIIIQSRQNSLVTANRLSQFLGKTSYSIYLWHWPIVVWINYFGLGKHPFWVFLGISASVLFGYLSYTFVENIARKRKVTPARSADSPLLNIGIPTSFAAAVGTIIVLSHGFPQRMSDEFYAAMERLDLPRATNGWCFYDVNTDESLIIGEEGLKCTLGNKGSSLKGLLFGDSFAGHYEPFWDRIGKEVSAEINSVTTNWCYPSADEVIYGDSSSRSYDQCLINRKYFLDNASSYDFVVLSGSWWKIDLADQMKGVYDAISYAASQAKLVVVMAAPTYFDVNIRDMYARSVMFDMDFDVNRFSRVEDAGAAKVNQEIKNYANQFLNVLYIDRSSLFHVNGVPSAVTEENIPYNYDQNGHISIYGSLMAADSFKKSSGFPELSKRIAEVRKRKNIELTLMQAIGTKEFKVSVPW
ncbi:acyltransferase, partial [Halomonas sp. BBD48]|nr:acyltransferase [Halomonas sp. BBD48]